MDMSAQIVFVAAILGSIIGYIISVGIALSFLPYVVKRIVPSVLMRMVDLPGGEQE